jgi:hypothetical protein
MTVAELIEYLQEEDQTLEVKFSYNSGDYWRTQIAKDIETVETGLVDYSDYHRMDKVVENDEDGTLVLLLS